MSRFRFSDLIKRWDSSQQPALVWRLLSVGDFFVNASQEADKIGGREEYLLSHHIDTKTLRHTNLVEYISCQRHAIRSAPRRHYQQVADSVGFDCSPVCSTRTPTCGVL